LKYNDGIENPLIQIESEKEKGGSTKTGEE
jgi:hypothetical protein